MLNGRRKSTICDGKNDELYELCWSWIFQMLNLIMAISETVRKIEKNHELRIEKKNCKWNISCYWWVAALRIALDKKDLLKSMTVRDDIHIIMALQRPETSVLDGRLG